MRRARTLLPALAVSLLASLAATAALPAASRAGGEAGLTLAAGSPRIVYGHSVTLAGQAHSDAQVPAIGVAVTILARAAGTAQATAVQTITTSGDGRFSVSLRPASTTTYSAEWSSPAGVLRASEVVVEVGSAVVFEPPPRLWKGEPATATGEVRPARPAGTPVTILKRDGTSWVQWQVVTLDDSSRFQVSWTAARQGRERLRALVAADALNSEGSSLPLKVVVLDPNPHRVPTRFQKVIVIDHSEFRLYFYESGRWLRRFACVLGKPSTPTPYGRFRIQRKRPHPGGANGAYYMGYLGVIGIHGTNEPRLLHRFPRAYSHGCCRLSNPHITWLYARTPIGTPVWNVR